MEGKENDGLGATLLSACQVVQTKGRLSSNPYLYLLPSMRYAMNGATVRWDASTGCWEPLHVQYRGLEAEFLLEDNHSLKTTKCIGRRNQGRDSLGGACSDQQCILCSSSHKSDATLLIDASTSITRSPRSALLHKDITTIARLTTLQPTSYSDQVVKALREWSDICGISRHTDSSGCEGQQHGLQHHALQQRHGILWGPAGSGKTTAVKRFVSSLPSDIGVYWIDCRELLAHLVNAYQSSHGSRTIADCGGSHVPIELATPRTPAAYIHAVFASAMERGRSVIVCDDLDHVTDSLGCHQSSSPVSDETGEVEEADGDGSVMEGKSIIVSKLIACLDALAPDDVAIGGDGDPPRHCNVMVIGVTSTPLAKLPAVLQSPTRFSMDAQMNFRHDPSHVTILKDDIERFANTTKSIMLDTSAAELYIKQLSVVDIERMALLSWSEATKAFPADNLDSTTDVDLSISKDHLKAAQSMLKPIGVADVNITVPICDWDDVCGYESLKQRLLEAIEWPLFHSDRLTELGVAPSSGVLLHGPSGCGKTSLVHAVASRVNVHLIELRAANVISPYLGESEAIIRRLFKKAREIAPCILFLDEIDALSSSRDHSSESGASSLSSRVLSCLLNEMDGIGGKSHQVFVVACTSRPDLVDTALKRPGRMDSTLLVDFPTKVDVEAILRRLLSSCALSPSDEQSMNQLVTSVSDKLVGRSCAGVYDAFREAVLQNLRTHSDGALSVVGEDRLTAEDFCV